MSAHASTLTLRVTKRDRSWADLALTWLLASLSLALVGALAFLLMGGKALIVRSGSMEPAIEVGDLVVTRTVHPTEVRVGDVVTFSDPTRSGVLVTHRAQKIEHQESRSSFVTKGDANGGVERWSIDSDGTVGRLMFRIPKFGYAAAWTAQPATRFALLVTGVLLLAYAGLRRIWAG